MEVSWRERGLGLIVDTKWDPPASERFALMRACMGWRMQAWVRACMHESGPVGIYEA